MNKTAKVVLLAATVWVACFGLWLVGGEEFSAESTPTTPQLRQEDETGTKLEDKPGREEQRQDDLGADSKQAHEIYNARTWQQLLAVSPHGFEDDLALALANAQRVCSLQLEQVRSIDALSGTTQKGLSIAFVSDFQRKFCTDFNAQLVANALNEMNRRADEASDLAVGTLAGQPSQKTPLAFQNSVFLNRGDLFSQESERGLGLGELSRDRQELIRVAAGLELRCRLYPGCEPNALLTVAACAPVYCSTVQSFSARFMAEHLSPNESALALALANRELRRRTR